MPIYNYGDDSQPFTTVVKTFASPAERDTFYQQNPSSLSYLDNYPEKTVKTTDDDKLWHRANNAWSEVVVPGDGGGIQSEGLTDHDIPVWDATKNKLVPSGAKGEDGSVTISPDSLHFGDHKMSSSPQNVIFTNTTTDKHYSPLWQSVDKNVDKTYMRDYGDVTEVVRVPYADNDVIDPENDIVARDDELFLGGHFWLSAPATNVYLEIVEGSILRWRQKVGDLPAGKHDVVFDVPLDIRDPYSYKVKLRSADGPITAKGTGSEFSWSAIRALWTEKRILTEDDILPPGKDYSSDITTLQGETATLTTESENLRTDVDKNTQDISDILSGVRERVWHRRLPSWSGTWPTDAHELYLVNLYAMKGTQQLQLPTALTGNMHGAIVGIFNEDSDDAIRVTAPPSAPLFGGRTAQNIPSGNFVFFINNNDVWSPFLSGYLPSSEATLINAVQKTLKSRDLLHTTSEIRSLMGAGQTGVTFVNPDGSEVTNVNKVQLVGMQMTDPVATGSTAKLTLQQGTAITPLSRTTAYAFFSTSPVAPDTIPPAGTKVFRGGTVLASKTNDFAEYVYILIPPGEGQDVRSIGETGGLPALWSKESKDYSGRTYTVYRSPYPYRERDIMFNLYT